MRAKLLVVAVALVLGAAAAFATFGYLSAIRKQAEAGSRMTEVLVAREDIPRGSYADDLLKSGAIQRVQVPQRYVAAGAISSVRSVADRILAVPVSKGEMLTAQRFQYPSEAGLAFNVPKDFVAVTVPVDEARGLAGLVKVGDRVAVVATIDPKTDSGEQTRITIPGAKVLAVGRSTGVDKSQEGGGANANAPLAANSNNAQAQPMTNVTLALSVADAEKVVFAIETGSIWLGLLPATQSAAGPGPGQTVSTLFK